MNEVLETLECMLDSHEESSKEYEALRIAINCVNAYMLEMLCRKAAAEIAQQQMDMQEIVLKGLPNEIADHFRAGFPAPPNNL